MQSTRLSTAAMLVAVVAMGCGNAPSAAQSPAPASASAPSAAGGEEVVAEVAGRKITLAEVDAKWQEFDAAERARLTQLLYQNRRNMLDLVMGDVLIAEAAKRANVSPDAFTERELAKHRQPVSDADIQRFYDENKERAQGRSLEQLRQPITDFLQSQRESQARAKLVDELRGKAENVRVLLEPPRVALAVEDHSPSNGPATAAVTIVEFSDYQCPFCARVTPTMAQLMKEYGGKIRRVFRDFPLPNHPQAQKAAEAARCAGDQGKYWEMHDQLFANQSALQVTDIKKAAGTLGLNQGTFDLCLDSDKYTARVRADLAEGEKLGVNSTPTLYVNGRPLIGAQPYETIKQVIDEELARAGK